LGVLNSGLEPATFRNGQVILRDDLPHSGVGYGAPIVTNVNNVTGSAEIFCGIHGSPPEIKCIAGGGDVTLEPVDGGFEVQLIATPDGPGAFHNPRSGGECKVDPDGHIIEGNEGNNTTSDSVTVTGGAVTIVKDVVPDDDSLWDFTLSGPTPGTKAGLGDGQSDAFEDLSPGFYTLSEATQPGYATTIDCGALGSAGDNDISLTLGPGQQVTCTFTNTRQAHIVIDKVTVPAGDTTGFDFELAGGPPSLNQSFSLTGATVPHNSGPVQPDSGYSITETMPSGWDLTSATCSDGSPVDDIDLDPGETVTCTFTDTIRTGSIQVCKDAQPDDTSQWDLTLHGPTPGTHDDLADGACHTFSDLLPGSYNLSETSQAGYASTVSCAAKGSDHDDDIFFTLDPGEHVTCTFTNTQQARIVIDKVTEPAGFGTAFHFSLTGGPSALDQTFSLTDATQPYDTGPIVPGAGYSVAETVSTGWDLTSATCGDGSHPADIHLDPGETVTCTFTNTVQTGSIQVCKEVQPHDASVWDLSLHGPTPGTYADLADGACYTFGDLLPGIYTLSETLQAGYASSVDCGSQGSDHDHGISLSLDPGERVTCTFTNTRLATLVIEKDARVGRGSSVLAFEVPGLVPGAYPVIEILSTPGVSLTAITCDDGDSATPSTWDLVAGSATFALDPGETVACAFTNLLPLAVGGAVLPVSPLRALAPWVGTVALLSLAALTVALRGRRRHR
jgi:hypothetical protein